MFENNRTSIKNVIKYAYNKTRRKLYTKKRQQLIHSQGVEQSLYYSYFPKDKDTSLQLSKKYLSAMQKLCEENNIKLIVSLLPSKIEVRDSHKTKIRSAFNLSEIHMNTNYALTKNLKHWLDQSQISYIDLLKPLKQSTKKMYWDHDYHINNDAHRLIGNYLFEKINFN